jgi:hypothetical protein
MNNLDTAAGVHCRYASAALDDGRFAGTLLTGSGHGALKAMQHIFCSIFK